MSSVNVGERASRMQLMELLVGCLYFAQRKKDSQEHEKESWIRTNRNALDAALKTARKRGAFPPWGKRSLHFADGRTGTICIELGELLDLACRCGCIEFDSTFCFVKVVTSPRVTLRFLREIGIGKNKAKKWGRFIREALEKEEKWIEEHP